MVASKVPRHHWPRDSVAFRYARGTLLRIFVAIKKSRMVDINNRLCRLGIERLGRGSRDLGSSHQGDSSTASTSSLCRDLGDFFAFLESTLCLLIFSRLFVALSVDRPTRSVR